MLQNAYFLAKISADTAKNEQHFAEILPKAGKISAKCCWNVAVVGAVLARRLARRTRRAGKLYKARSRLYRSHNLQVSMRWKALAEIYTMHSLAPFWNPQSKTAPFSNLKIFVKIAETIADF